MACARAASAREMHHARGNGDAACREHRLGALLVHGKRGGEHAGMGVANSERLEHALDAAVLAVAPVQSVEADIGLELGEPGSHVAADIEPGHAVAFALERSGASSARAERHFAL